MKRPACKLAIGVIIGIIGGLYWESQSVLISLFLIMLAICASKLKFSQKFIFNSLFCSKKIWTIIIFILVSSLPANIYMQYIEKQYSCENEKLRNMTYWNAVVVSNKMEKEYKEQYVVQFSNGMRCNLYISKGKVNISYGDEIMIYGEYQEIEKQKNPGGYDANITAKTKKIVGTILAEKIEVTSHEKINKMFYMIFQIKNYAIKQIEEKLPKETSYLVQALVLGEKSQIPDEVMEDFRSSNLSHMLAISGAHISYILLAILYCERFCSKKTLQIFLIFFLIFFAILVGGTPSVVRACMMSGMFILEKLLHRRCCIYTNMAISILVLCIENPYCLWNLGLQLSYVGTLGILVLTPVLQSYTHMWITCGRQT